MRHNPAFVRMNPTDGTLHCERHGLLTDDEALDVYRRVGVGPAAVEEIRRRWPRSVTRLIDLFGQMRHREECEA